MKYEISDDKAKLTLIADECDLEALRQMKAEPQYENQFDCDLWLCDFLEPLLCNSELEWIEPHETGDLTDAPMIGIYQGDDELPEAFDGRRVHSRWAFMDYQVISVQQRLLDTGKAVFVGGPLDDSD